MTIKRISVEEAKRIKGSTDWERIDKLTDAEIEEAARSDPDSALPTDEELKRFRRVKEKKDE